ncbi:hypothetical protein [[Pseudomonas] boreopolis]|uniref:hypothetical protein n=1 Tax=Xanthomonas boreopolis TaxID=86183 RepID=UPI003DA07D2B
MNESRRSLAHLAVLAGLMLATRINHFAPVPDASWALFFVAGFQLRRQVRWVFPLLMALAVAIDWAVIRGQGIDFWRHYCVSPGYIALVPAYFALWAGGAWLRGRYRGAGLPALGRAAGALVASVALCHLIAQASFYWTSASVPAPSIAGWARNYADWFLPYLGTSALYVGIAAAVQWASERFGHRALQRPLAH